MTEVNFVLYVFYIPVYNFLNLFVFRDVWYQWVTSWLFEVPLGGAQDCRKMFWRKTWSRMKATRGPGRPVVPGRQRPLVPGRLRPVVPARRCSVRTFHFDPGEWTPG